MTQVAKQFVIAKSSNGTLGLITSPEMVDHIYPDNNEAKVWTGVIIEDNTFQGRGGDADKTIHAKAGGFWSSSRPEVVREATENEIKAAYQLREETLASLAEDEVDA